MFSKNRNVTEFINTIKDNKFKSFKEAYEFVKITQIEKNFEDMKNYTKNVFDNFRKNLS